MFRKDDLEIVRRRKDKVSPNTEMGSNHFSCPGGLNVELKTNPVYRDFYSFLTDVNGASILSSQILRLLRRVPSHLELEHFVQPFC
jgi:hypothetical protein